MFLFSNFQNLPRTSSLAHEVLGFTLLVYYFRFLEF